MRRACVEAGGALAAQHRGGGVQRAAARAAGSAELSLEKARATVRRHCQRERAHAGENIAFVCARGSVAGRAAGAHAPPAACASSSCLATVRRRVARASVSAAGAQRVTVVCRHRRVVAFHSARRSARTYRKCHRLRDHGCRTGQHELGRQRAQLRRRRRGAHARVSGDVGTAPLRQKSGARASARRARARAWPP